MSPAQPSSPRRLVAIVGAIAGLIRQQPLRYGASLILWSTIWTIPVIVGVIVARFFDALVGQAGGGIAWFLAALAAYGLARVAVIFVAMRNHSRLLFQAGAGVRIRLIRRLFGQPGALPVAESSGEVVSRFRDDVEHLVEAFDFTVDLAGACLSAAIAIGILASIDPFITLVVFTPIVVVIVLASRTGARVRRYRREARDATEAITGFLGESLGSVQAIKVAGAEDDVLRRFDQLNETRRRMMVRDRTFTAVLEAIFRNTVNIGTGVILVLAAGTLATAEGLSVGEFTLFVFLLAQVTESAYFIGIFLARLEQAGVSLQRLTSLFPGTARRQLVSGRRDRLGEAPVRPAAGADAPLASLNADGLSYRYPGTDAGVTDVDLEVRRGEFVVVTGRIGTGKTTLLRLLLGLLDADAGEVRWNGQPVAPAEYMVPPRTAYTPQVPRLFSMSLRDNLLLGEDRSERDVEAAMADAVLDRDVAAMPDGLDTLVGPNGVRLSGGQIQRAAAARMFIRDADLMVFDDLSSALDVETEAKLWERVLARPGATALVVSHRRPALLRADRIVLMRDGVVAATGSLEDVMDDPEFRQVWTGADAGS